MLILKCDREIGSVKIGTVLMTKCRYNDRAGIYMHGIGLLHRVLLTLIMICWKASFVNKSACIINKTGLPAYLNIFSNQC